MFFSSRDHTLLAPREIRRVSLAGGAPEALSINTVWDRSDVSADGRLLYQTSPDSGAVYDPRTRKLWPIPDLSGDPLWSRDGRTFAYVVRPGTRKPSDAGLWVGRVDGVRNQVFQGWVVSYAWGNGQDLFVLEGKPNLSGVLWHLDSAARRTLALSGVGLYKSELEMAVSSVHFDIHPDGRRIAIDALELLEADIGMIDNVR
jgi:hypothetical protein